MSNLPAKLAGVATLALAVLPVAALTTAAHAQPAPQHIEIGDLDLSTKAGVAAFDERVQRVSWQMCRDAADLRARAACQSAIHEEARDKLAEAISARATRIAVR
jgi:UrcA family protein